MVARQIFKLACLRSIYKCSGDTPNPIGNRPVVRPAGATLGDALCLAASRSAAQWRTRAVGCFHHQVARTCSPGKLTKTPAGISAAGKERIKTSALIQISGGFYLVRKAAKPGQGAMLRNAPATLLTLLQDRRVPAGSAMEPGNRLR